MRGEYKTKRTADVTSRNELQKLIAEMERQMKEAAKNLEFERAAALRDEMYELKSLLADDPSLKPWEKIKLLAGEVGLPAKKAAIKVAPTNDQQNSEVVKTPVFIQSSNINPPW